MIGYNILSNLNSIIKRILVLGILLVISLTLAACNSNEYSPVGIKDNNQENLIFHLDFDKPRNNYLTDNITKNKAYINYIFNNAKYQENQSTRFISESAISKKAMTFDGYSNDLSFPSSTLEINENSFSIDVFIAPRYFEWDVPNAIENNHEKLQTIIGQFDSNTNEGFILGMHKYGSYSFQIGINGQIIKLFNEWNPLDRYTWNHITATFNGEDGYMAIYKNGYIVNYLEDLEGEFILPDEPLLIGKSHNPQYVDVFELNKYNGLMDELKIYDKALTDEEVYEYHSQFLINGSLKEVNLEDVMLNSELVKDDIYHPNYHATPPQHWMNEPHSLFYYNGYYHLFYQYNPLGPYWRQIVWGHWVSKDMVNWKNLKEAIIPSPTGVIRDGAWSGSVAYRKDGSPVLFITAGDDNKSYGQYSNQNIVIATPKDLNDPYLREWVVHNELVVTAPREYSRANEFRDPNIYYEDGVYYMVVGSSEKNYQGTAFLYTTRDDSFLNWDFEGKIFTPPTYYPFMGSTWELTNLSKLTNEDKSVSKYIFIFSPAGNNADNDVYYYLGDFDKETKKFIPENEYPLLMDYGNNVFTGPTVSVDPLTGRVLISSILQDQRSSLDHYYSGYAFMAGIPRELSLNGSGNLIVRPLTELNNIISDELISLKDVSLDIVNEKVKGIAPAQAIIHVNVAFDELGIFNMELYKDNLGNKAILKYNASTNYISIDTTNTKDNRIRGVFGGNVKLIDSNILDLKIFIDKSTMECYINDEIVLTAMVYNDAYNLSLSSNVIVYINDFTIKTIETIER